MAALEVNNSIRNKNPVLYIMLTYITVMINNNKRRYLNDCARRISEIISLSKTGTPINNKRKTSL